MAACNRNYQKQSDPVIKKKTVIAAAFLIFLSSAFESFASEASCYLSKNINEVVSQIKPGDCHVVDYSDPCFRTNPEFIFQASIVEPLCLKKAPDIIRLNQDLVLRIFKANNQILETIDDQLKRNPDFMLDILKANNNQDFYPLEYASPNLLDDELFIKQAIEINAKNYFYASDRVKNIASVAKIAFSNNGLVIAYATEDIKHDLALVKIAVKSDPDAIEFLDQEMKRKLSKSGYKQPKKVSPDVNYSQLVAFIKNNYFQKIYEDGSYKIGNQGKFTLKNQILVNRNITNKWQKIKSVDKYRLVAIDDQYKPWEQDFARYPDLIKKIEEYLLKRGLDQNMIEQLKTRYLWIVNSNPLILVFNLYRISPTIDSDSAVQNNNVTSVIMIAKKFSKGWIFSPIQEVIAKEVKLDITYKYGYKEYELLDIYKAGKKDHSPKIIFKIEDKFKQYIQIFSEGRNSKYLLLGSIDNS